MYVLIPHRLPHHGSETSLVARECNHSSVGVDYTASANLLNSEKQKENKRRIERCSGNILVVFLIALMNSTRGEKLLFINNLYLTKSPITTKHIR